MPGGTRPPPSLLPRQALSERSLTREMASMTQRFWAIVATATTAAVALVVIVFLYKPPVRDQVLGNAELVMSAAPGQGSWAEPEEGKRWEERRRKRGIALSRRRENG